MEGQFEQAMQGHTQVVLPATGTVQEEKSASAGPGDLGAKGDGLTSRLVQRINGPVADLAGQFLFQLPDQVQEQAEVVEGAGPEAGPRL